ncbi:hypothetical protein WG899_11100 [Paucibacter sp. AS339]|uniref:hypothetical protein n=1 Tax=Paucibacter hankyongi TaxID=3133434 RepID=UPI0030B01FBC
MGSKTSSLELVRRFWALYQARRWAEAQALLSPAAYCVWWATTERFAGAAAIVHVNAVYPEGWAIHLLELNHLDDGASASSSASADTQHRLPVLQEVQRVHSLVRVDQNGQSFYANSFFKLQAGLILSIEEYWADTQAPPAWRSPGALPGLHPLAPDQRQGLSLDLLPPP